MYNKNKNNGNNGNENNKEKINEREEVIKKVKVIIDQFYREEGRGLNVVFDGLNELIRSWGYEPREIIQELAEAGYKIVPGRSKNGVGYIKIFPPGTILNKSAKELVEKYLSK